MNETLDLTLPVSGKIVVIKGYVTGLIDQEVNQILAGANKSHYEVNPSELSDSNTLPESGKMVIETDPTATIKAEQKLTEMMLISVDGVSTDVYNKFMGLPKQDVDYVTGKIKELQNASTVNDDQKKI